MSTRAAGLRPEVTPAIDAAWARLGEPGSQWSGADRVTMVDQARSARHCQLCATRKLAISPYAVDGDHQGAAALPAAVVDAVHRIATDSGRLSTRWHDELAESGCTDPQLVEVIHVTVTAIAVDTFDRAVGLAVRDLPTPSTGRPHGQVSDTAVRHSARVPTVRPDDAVGEIAEIYRTRSLEGQDEVPNIVRALSLIPDSLTDFYSLSDPLYVLGMDEPGPAWRLSRPQIELVAATVSGHNDCFY